jgi:hypothetical protein
VWASALSVSIRGERFRGRCWMHWLRDSLCEPSTDLNGWAFKCMVENDGDQQPHEPEEYPAIVPGSAYQIKKEWPR